MSKPFEQNFYKKIENFKKITANIGGQDFEESHKTKQQIDVMATASLIAESCHILMEWIAKEFWVLIFDDKKTQEYFKSVYNHFFGKNQKDVKTSLEQTFKPVDLFVNHCINLKESSEKKAFIETFKNLKSIISELHGARNDVSHNFFVEIQSSKWKSVSNIEIHTKDINNMFDLVIQFIKEFEM